MSQPTFDVARHDIWYTDGGTGFYVVHVTNGAWPGTAGVAADAVRSHRGLPGAHGSPGRSAARARSGSG